MKIIKAKPGDFIVAGQQGEELARRVEFDVAEWERLYGPGTVQLLVKRMTDETFYPTAIEQEHGVAVWNVTVPETSVAGKYHTYELRYYAGETLAKAVGGRFSINEAFVGEEGEVPEVHQGWVEQIIATGAGSLAAQKAAEAARDEAIEAQLNANLANTEAQTAKQEAANYAESALKAENNAKEYAKNAKTSKEDAEIAALNSAASANASEKFSGHSYSYYINASNSAKEANKDAISADQSAAAAKASEVLAAQNAANAKTSEQNAMKAANEAAESAQGVGDTKIAIEQAIVSGVETIRAEADSQVDWLKQEVSSQAKRAETAANAAEVSEKNAKTSETNSANSEAEAKKAAAEATHMRNDALSYKVDASNAAQDAKNAKAGAEQYAQNASNSEANASQYAADASASASNAQTFMAGAETARSQAQTSAQAASNFSGRAEESEATAKQHAETAKTNAKAAKAAADSVLGYAEIAESSATSAYNNRVLAENAKDSIVNSEEITSENAEKAAKFASEAKTYKNEAVRAANDASASEGNAKIFMNSAYNASNTAAVHATNASMSAKKAEEAASRAGGVQSVNGKLPDENGNVEIDSVASWNDLTDKPFGETKEVVEILPECTVNMSVGMGFLDQSISATVGQSYTVKWNGTEYECVAQQFEMEGSMMTALGNVGAASGGASTGEPFVIMIYSDGASGGTVVPMDGSTSVTLSIRGEQTTITPLPAKYLPEGVPYIEGGMVEMPATGTWADSDGDGVIDGYMFSAPIGLEAGKTYIVNWDGKEYEVVARAQGDGVDLGNAVNQGGSDTGEPFMIMEVSEETAAIIGMYGAIQWASADYGSGEVPFGIYQNKQTIRKLDSRCLPDTVATKADIFGAMEASY